MSTEPAAAYPNNSIVEAVFPISLAPVATFAKEPVLDELERLYRKTGFSGSADPKQALFGLMDPQDLELEDGVSLYGHLTQKRATVRIDGMTLKEALNDLFASPDYNEAVDADAGQKVTSLGDPSRAYMVSRVFDRYNRAIKAEVAASSDIALRYMTAAAAKHRDDAYLSDVPLEQLATNPDLYGANGINPETYSGKLTERTADEEQGSDPAAEPEEADEPERPDEEPAQDSSAEELLDALESGGGDEPE